MNFVRQAILTRYLPPANIRGARIKAVCDAGSVTISYPHELSGAEVHLKAAQALMDKLGWTGELICGGLPDKGTKWSYCFVMKP